MFADGYGTKILHSCLRDKMQYLISQNKRFVLMCYDIVISPASDLFIILLIIL